MTGPEHYSAGERCLQAVNDDSEQSLALIAEAQAHFMAASVYAHNRATTELTGLLRAMMDELREHREAQPTAIIHVEGDASDASLDAIKDAVRRHGARL